QQWVEFFFKQVLGGGGSFNSPIKASVKWLPKTYDSVLKNGLGLEGKWLAAVLIVTALAMIIVALIVITKNMRLLMADRIEEWINRVLKKSGLLGLTIGAGTTALVQSSSITTSLLIPMFGAGVLTLEAGFPIMIGANIGTTVTALLAATVAIGPAGLTIALVHLLFNLTGTLIFFPFRPIRQIPIKLAEKLAELTVKNRIWVLVYIIGTFVVAPLLGIFIWRS
ncbi:MAG: Na/Pi symporter, partial [Planctomycetota bacterium]|nr:Na/Pi symporter [Planctomycetota bacterium]